MQVEQLLCTNAGESGVCRWKESPVALSVDHKLEGSQQGTLVQAPDTDDGKYVGKLSLYAQLGNQSPSKKKHLTK